MKKRMLFSAICLIFLVTFMIGDTPSYAREKSLLVTAGGVGGSWFIAGAAFTEVWEKSIPDLKTQLVPGGGRSNPIRVDKGDADVGFTYATNAIAAMKGADPYKDKMPNIMGIASLQIKQYLTLSVARDTGITSFEDIISKKFPLKLCPGTRGLGGELTFRRVMDEYGFSYQDITKWGGKIYFAGWNESVSQIRDGHANALTTQTPLQNPFVVELCSSRDMKFLPLKNEVVENLKNKYGFLGEVIPKGSYIGMDEDYLTVADSVILICNQKVSDEMTYLLAKYLCENAKKWQDTHVMFTPFRAENTPLLPKGLNIHPGAEKYYKEMGYLK